MLPGALRMDNSSVTLCNGLKTVMSKIPKVPDVASHAMSGDYCDVSKSLYV